VLLGNTSSLLFKTASEYGPSDQGAVQVYQGHQHQQHVPTHAVVHFLYMLLAVLLSPLWLGTMLRGSRTTDTRGQNCAGL
jgi:hypothetical protein